MSVTIALAFCDALSATHWVGDVCIEQIGGKWVCKMAIAIEIETEEQH
ncbi:MAG: hypothetical protein HC857_14245 [Synechococcales cyanobacterium RU_4_20]|nr:hypothetical protein [Synechococcales cyanobacterium RU_4_20]